MAENILEEQHPSVTENRENFWTEWVKNKKPEEIGQMLAAKELEAETDPLTGLTNGRGWNRQAEILTSLSDREGKPVSFVYIDLDDFKHINDTWGHEVGNQVLIFVSEVLINTQRQSDLVARIGGDEFAVLLPLTNEIGSREVKQKIINELQRSLQEMDATDPLAASGVSLSVGVSTREMGGSIDEALTRAENDMYGVKRKNNG